MKNGKRLPIWLIIILDLVLAALVLLVFAFFHHVLPAMQANNAIRDQLSVSAQSQTNPPAQTQTLPAASSEPTQSMPTDAPGTLWQRRFCDRFTKETIITDHSYSSPNVCINIDTVVKNTSAGQLTYYVADIYVAEIDNFITCTAHNKMLYFDTQDALEMANEGNAILAISGDFLTYQKNGFLVRNGQVYCADRNYSICALYRDGTIETLDRGTYQIEDVLAKDPVQVWSFGPVLLDADGTVRDSYDVSTAVGYPNPRSALGYYEPGHYCFVIVDGRQTHSCGVTIPQLAAIFEELGCKVAYNLDGGGTALMVFNGKKVSKQSNGGREVGDLLVITEEGFSVSVGEG